MRSKTAVVACATAVVALGTAAGPAWATDGFSLQLSGPSSAVLGQPLSLIASGSNPSVADYPYPTYLDVELFRPDVVSACPATQSAAGGLAATTGGAVLAWDVQMDVEATGSFSIPFGVTPLLPGSVLLCGYTAGLAGETLASASFTLPVQAAGPSTPQTPGPTGTPQSSGTGTPQSSGTGTPQSTGTPRSAGTGSPAPGIPTQVRRGIRSCLALLAPKDARGCIRNAVGRGNRACRRLHSPSGRTACLRTVRKLARRYS